MVDASTTFKHRSFVAMVLLITGLSLPVTGLANHVYGFASLSVARHAWMAAHNALGVLFVLFSIWHLVLNRAALWHHVKMAAARLPLPNRELAFAGLLVAVVLVLFVGHAFHLGS